MEQLWIRLRQSQLLKLRSKLILVPSIPLIVLGYAQKEVLEPYSSEYQRVAARRILNEIQKRKRKMLRDKVISFAQDFSEIQDFLSGDKTVELAGGFVDWCLQIYTLGLLNTGNSVAINPQLLLPYSAVYDRELLPSRQPIDYLVEDILPQTGIEYTLSTKNDKRIITPV